MGSNKNKCNHRNNHRHVFKRRHHPQKYYRSASTENSQPLNGSRIVNLEKLQEYIDKLTVHTTKCGSEIKISGEYRNGLAAILTTGCSKCGHSITLETLCKVKGPRGYCRWECNLAAVWGQMSSGGGFSKLSETMSTIGIPVRSARHFINTERDIGEWW